MMKDGEQPLAVEGPTPKVGAMPQSVAAQLQQSVAAQLQSQASSMPPQSASRGGRSADARSDRSEHAAASRSRSRSSEHLSECSHSSQRSPVLTYEQQEHARQLARERREVDNFLTDSARARSKGQAARAAAQEWMRQQSEAEEEDEEEDGTPQYHNPTAAAAAGPSLAQAVTGSDSRELKTCKWMCICKDPAAPKKRGRRWCAAACNRKRWKQKEQGLALEPTVGDIVTALSSAGASAGKKFCWNGKTWDEIA